MIGRVSLAALLLTIASPVWADDGGLHDLCPDRPGKGTGTCTVDAGHFQVEVDAFDATLQHEGSVTTDTYIAAAPLLKYGVTDDWDIEVAFTPFEAVRTRDASGSDTQTGIGDLFLRTKFNLAGNEGGALGIAFEPFLKIPTANKELGNGTVEGGALLPLAYDLGSGWSIASTPEVDVLRNQSRDGYHADIINVVGIGRAFDGGVTLGAEAWESSELDPAGATQQYSLDFDAAWQPDSNLQLDGGVNVGLNRATPDVQIYAGVSRRF